MLLTADTMAELPEELDCPWEVEYIWAWFCKLNGRRINGMSVGPITHQEITAWSERMELNVTPFETEALLRIDDAFIIHSSKTEKDKK
jgi:hypothetical protein